MRLTTTLVATAAIAVCAVPANANNLTPPTVEAPVAVEPAPDPGSPSMIAAFLIAGVFSTLFTAALIAGK